MDRRTFLQGGIASAVLATLVERGVLAAQPGAAFGPAAVRSLAPAPTATRTPYSLAISSALSEDYFMTAAVPIDTTVDSVAPFVSPNGQVEALIMSGGVLSYLARDATQQSGWSYTAVPGLPSSTFPDGSIVAAAWDPISRAVPYLLAVVIAPTVANSPSVAVIVTYDSVNGWNSSTDTTSITSPSVVSVRAMHAKDGTAYIYAVGSDGVISAWGADIDVQGPLTTALQNEITDALLLYGNPLWSTPGDPSLGILGLGTDGNAYWYPWSGTQYGAGVNQGQASQLLWAGYGSTPNGPDFLFRSESLLLGFIAFTSTLAGAVDLVVEEAVAWSEASQPSFAVLGANAITILSGLDGLNTTPGVTIETGIAAIYGTFDVASTPTLFVADDQFGFLSVLTKDPATSAWSLTPIMLPASEALDVSNWRTQITVLDVNGAPAAGVPISVTAESTVGVWQMTGNTTLGPTTAMSFTTDQHGMVTIALAALDLQPPVITAQLSGSSPVNFSPGTDVQNFLAGTAPLNGMPAITPADPSALLGNGPDGQPLTNLTSTAGASAVASSLNSTMAVAATPGPLPGNIQSFKLDLTGSVPAYSESQSPSSPSTQPDDVYLNPTGSLGSWWDKVKADFHTVEHAIRKGAIAVEQCTAALAADGRTWIITLGVAVTTDLKDIAVFIVTDLESAITAIHGVLHAIAVDVDRAIQWLRMALSGLFQEVESNTQLILGMLNEFPGVLTGLLQSAPALVNQYFFTKEAVIDSRLGDLVTTTQGWTLDNFSDSSSGSVGAFDPSTILTDVRHNWLLDKVLHEFDEALQAEGTNSAIGDALSAVVDIIAGIDQLIGEIADAIVNALYTALTDASQLKTMGVPILVEMLQTISGDVLNFADTVIQDLLTLANAVIAGVADALTLPVPGLNLLGALLSKFGVNIDTSVGHVFVLMLMFPTTLAHRLLEDGTPLFPSTSSTSDTSVDWAKALGYTHGVARILQGLSDVVADAYTLGAGSVTKGPLKWTAMADAVWGACLQLVVWPGAKVNGVTQRPFSTHIADDTVGNLAIWKYALGFLGPLLGFVFTAGAWNGPRFYSDWAPYLVAGTFAGSLGLGIAADAETGASITTAVIGTLETLPRVVAPLATAQYNENSEGAAVIIKLITDALEAAAGGSLVALAAEAP
jgi:hypothetical protein